jgi:hypothetical protein
MARTNEERYQEAEQFLVREAIRQTEQEIVDDAFNAIPEEGDGDTSLEEIEGWNGLSLSDEEIAHRNIYGDDDVYFDRPIEGRERDELAAENEQLRAAYSDLQGRVDQVINGPERQEAMRAQARVFLEERYGILGTDERIDQLVNDIVAQETRTQGLHEERVNRSMSDAHAQYGSEFEEAFRSITSMDKSNPTARALAADVFNAPDPGERLMALHRNGINGGLSRDGGGRRDAFSETYGYMGERAPVRSGRGGGRSAASQLDDSYARGTRVGDGFGDRDVEQDIFESAFR